MVTETPETVEEAAPRPLRDEIIDVLAVQFGHREAATTAADDVMQLLHERGHYLPGAPPAQQILEDAKSFAERLTLSNLALRCFAMLGSLSVDTPETQPAKRWIVDYIEGKNHGPVGQPMLWPEKLPGLAHMLREWGFMPTPTTPPYVCRALPNPTVQ